MALKKLWLALSFLVQISPIYAQISEGKGVYAFFDFKPVSGKAMDVYYYKPQGDASKMPILFVMHGVLRNADTYRDNWVELADKYKILIIVPQFTQANFRGDRGYAFGNVQAKSGELNDPSIWSLTLIDKIFDVLVKQTNSKQTKYDLFGHSAGSQFVHRFIIFTEKNKANRVVTANAGSYTMLDNQVNYPFGIKGVDINDDRLKLLLQKDLVVQLGDKDIDPNHKQLPKSEEAMKQGAFRWNVVSTSTIKQKLKQSAWACHLSGNYVL